MVGITKAVIFVLIAIFAGALVSSGIRIVVCLGETEGIIGKEFLFEFFETGVDSGMRL